MDLLALKLWLEPPCEQLRPYFGREAVAWGHLEPLTLKLEEGRGSFVLQCESLQLGAQSLAYTDKLRVYATASNLPRVGRVRVVGRLEELRSFANPGGMDMESYNWVQGYGGMLTRASVELVTAEPRWMDRCALINLSLRKKLIAAVPGEVAAVLSGMTLGGSGGLSDTTRESIAANGLSHLLSVSGTHLLLLAAFLRLLLGRLLPRWQGIALALLLFFYACLCGLKPPVLRAWGMTCMLLWGGGREADRGAVFCLVCLLSLLYQPVWLLDLGFQLSFGAAAGLLWLLPQLQLKLRDLLPLPELLNAGLAVTLAAQLGTLPLLLANFSVLSLVSLLSNLVLVPVLELATILTLLGMGVCYIWTPLGNLLWEMAAWLVRQIMLQAAWLQSLPGSTLVIGQLPMFCSIVYYGALGCWLDLGPLKLLTRLERRIYLGVSCLILAGCYAYQLYAPLPVSIYFLDVGQGDAAVVVSGHRAAVIDTGGLKGLDTGARIVAPFLHSLGFNSVELLLPSHGDSDHIGGGAGLARNVRVQHVVLPKEEFAEEGLANMQALLRHCSAAIVETARSGSCYELGEATLRILSVPGEKATGNDASTVVELFDRSTGQKALFMGDCSSLREQELQGRGAYQVLKVGHHGSKTSSSAEFLDVVQPQLAVISCGKNNMYHHPHRETLERLQQRGCHILRTDRQGCIKVEFTGEGMRVQSWREVS